MSKFALGTVAVFFVVFVFMLLSSVWAPVWMSRPALEGLSWGHLIFLSLHIPAVIAAWVYIRQGDQKGRS